MKVYFSFLLLFLCCQIAKAQDSSRIGSNVSYAIFDDPEVMARFPGGEDSLMTFITRNLSYSKIQSCVGGTVYVEFDIDLQGRVRKPRIMKGLGSGFDESVIKLIKLMPKWKPALRIKTPIKSTFVLPVHFEH